MALREIIARFGFQVDQAGLKKAQSGIAGVVGGLKTLGLTIGAGIVARGIKNFVTDIVDAGDALGKTATQLGLTGKELQAWQTAANFAGVETASLNQGFRILGKNALLAQQGSKQAADAFRELGVEIEGANGQLKPANQLAREAGVALGALEDRTKAVGLAQQVFGRAGAALLPLFKEGEEGLDAALRKLEEFGGGLSDELIPLAEAAQDRFTEWGIATTSLKSKIAVALLPALNQLVLGVSKAFTWIGKIVDRLGGFKSLLITLGLVLAKVAIAKFATLLLRLGRAALIPLAKFVLLFLVIDDLIALFEGRGSLIGDFIDKIFGKGTAAAIIKGIKGVASAVSDFVKTGDLEKLDSDLEEIFGPPGEALVEGVIQIGKDLAEFWDLLWTDIRAGIDEGLAAGWAAVVGFAEDFATAAEELGAAIIDGIVEAVKGGAKAVAEAVGSVATGAVDWAKKLLGADSPAKVPAKEIGEPFVMGIAKGALDAASAAARMTAQAVAATTGVTAPRSVSAPVRGATGAGVPVGSVVFKSDIALSVTGGSVSDPQIQKLRQGVRSELRDNRRATLDALVQTVEVPA